MNESNLIWKHLYARIEYVTGMLRLANILSEGTLPEELIRENAVFKIQELDITVFFRSKAGPISRISLSTGPPATTENL